MSLLTDGPLSVTAPLVAISSLPLILDGACGYGDPMLATIDIEKLLAVERTTVEKGKD